MWLIHKGEKRQIRKGLRGKWRQFVRYQVATGGRWFWNEVNKTPIKGGEIKNHGGKSERHELILGIVLHTAKSNCKSNHVTIEKYIPLTQRQAKLSQKMHPKQETRANWMKRFCGIEIEETSKLRQDALKNSLNWTHLQRNMHMHKITTNEDRKESADSDQGRH